MQREREERERESGRHIDRGEESRSAKDTKRGKTRREGDI